jgi:hypothetical protein
MKTYMAIDENTRKKIIDLYFYQRKTVREVSRITGKSSRDITPVLHDYKMEYAKSQNNKEQVQAEKNQTEDSIPNVKAYKLFSEGKDPIQVSAELNLPGPQVIQYYIEYWELRDMHQLYTLYQENKDSIGYSLKAFRLARKEGLSPLEIANNLGMANNIQGLKEQYQHFQKKIMDSKEQLIIQKNRETEKDLLSDVQKANKITYVEFMIICSQVKSLEYYIEQIKKGQSYLNIEQIASGKVQELLMIRNRKRLLENALVSLIIALRNNTDRNFLIEKMPVTTTILYGPLEAIRKHIFEQGNGPSIKEKVLQSAVDIFGKHVVDSTISTAVGLENGVQDSTTYPA